MTNEPAALAAALRDRYRIERELGRGGMATVYLAHDLKHDRAVALKVLLPEVAAAFGPDRFLREIRLTARLDHPGILALLDSGEAGGSLYYVMPFVEGETLRDRLRQGPLPLDAALAIGAQVARALHHAHEHGVVHRDIKPENILLAGDHARVADFGIARPTALGEDALTQTGIAIGTPAYMSPEQATGASDVDRRTDVYSLGCVVYEMLAGEAPWAGHAPQVVLARKLQEPMPSLRVLRATVPPGVEAAVRTSLAPTPADRQATAELFAEALERGVREGGRPATPPGRRTTPRWRLLAAAALVAALALAGGWWAVRLVRGPAVIDSLAVLPLDNLTGDSAQAYFVDGIHEALTTELSQISALKVISRTSAMRYRGGGTPAPEIARELGVKGLVEGAVTREGNQVRVTVQLIDAARDRRLWGRSFTRELRGILALHTEVARAIAGEIEATLTPGEEERLSAARPVDPRAFEYYLLGRHQWNRRTVQLTREAILNFREALRLDSAYAPAQAALGDAYLWLGEQGALRQDEGCGLASTAIHAALAADPSVTEAHIAMAQWQLNCNWNWPEAERSYRTALELNPGSAVVHQYYGRGLSRVTRRLDEGLREIQRARELDPLSPTIRAYLGQHFLFARQFDAAAETFAEALALTPDHALLLHSAGEAALARGRWDEAIAFLERSLQQPGQQSSHYLAVLGAAYARGSRREDALRIQAELGRRAGEGLVSAFDLAHLSLALGDGDQALTWLERGLEHRDYWMAEMLAWPWFDALRSTARFQEVARTMGLPW
ncbi:MAG TPA: protein kinase [Gemmatimonadales bacterium]|nr:protein kinase [Gemmatimonadales bacterium]